jgi:hypothetical protein
LIAEIRSSTGGDPVRPSCASFEVLSVTLVTGGTGWAGTRVSSARRTDAPTSEEARPNDSNQMHRRWLPLAFNWRIR